MDEIVYLQKAKENLVVAEWCLEQGHCNTCVGRVYYAMFQVALAALIHFEVAKAGQAYSHEWIQANFAAELVKKRKVFPGYQAHLMELQDKRNTADYGVQHISKKQAKHLFKTGKDFVETILKVLHES